MGKRNQIQRPQYDRREVMQCHGFRKFFSTTCTLQGLPPLTVELLMGHKALGITGVYFKPTANDLLEGNDKMLGYANIMKFLTISEENMLRLEVKKLTKEQDEIALMKLNHEREMNQMREEMNMHYNQIMLMMQENPKLTQIKPEALNQKQLLK